MVSEVNRRLLLKKKYLLLLMLYRRRQQRSSKYRKDFWIRRIFLERESKGLFHILVHELKIFDEAYFYRNFRMSPLRFEELLSWVGPPIFKSNMRRSCASPEERLSLTLRYLATGDSQFTISTGYRVSPTTTGRIILETTNIIWNQICKRGYLKHPNSEKEWRQISNEFFELWNFPHCLGCIDGKHVII